MKIISLLLLTALLPRVSVAVMPRTPPRRQPPDHARDYHTCPCEHPAGGAGLL